MTVLTTEPTSYHHGDLRNVLIKTGREMLEADGLRGFSLRALARNAQVSHAAPVHHFKNLDAFFADCRTDGFRELSDALENAKITASGPPVNVLTRMAMAYLDFGSRCPVMLRLMFDKDTAPPRTDNPESQSRRAYLLLQDAVGETLSGAPRDPRLFDIRINAVWSLIHGFVILQNEDQICGSSDPPISTEEMLARSLAAMLESG
ncbi:TetR family transcriptional regulator [Litoreibacter ponti]|uniref:TetR family transcriptional regulator n=1 Tax=Litoreibacter ponti TaxID=1510457 RepID=A0A2T6BMX3_9RHOB|nr:TetR-like C-terminal domain-containing protein [Litoreibacter ponti]PTX57419.1 TetR family transcriptional regulator [Litoreibacter ponti]